MGKAHYLAQKASTEFWNSKNRYENNNPKNLLKYFEFKVLRWWRMENQ